MEYTLFVIVLALTFAPFVVLVFGPNLRADKPVARRRRSASGLAAPRWARRKAVREGPGLPALLPPTAVGGGAPAPVRLRPARRSMRPRFRRGPGDHSRGPR